MFVVLLTYTAPLPAIDELLPDHRQWLQGHYADGTFLLSGRQEPRTGGVILARGPSRAWIEAVCAQDPFALAGLATHTVVEVLPTMADLPSLVDAVSASLAASSSAPPSTSSDR
jgi:uncharacterized protein YciI